MPLESLLTLVEKLRERIDDHAPLLRQNEALTRYTLIDPLLRELGWNTENPDLVIPEYKGVGGSADYALFNGDKPLMIVEAKRLDTSLRDEKVLTQGLTYCQKQGTRYLSVTDGRRWEIYETHKLASIDEKRIVEFDLKSQSVAEVCLKALTLWGLRVSGHVATGQISVVGPTHNQPDSPKSRPPTPQPTPPSPDEHEWRPLSELNPQPGSRHPIGIQFLDGSVISTKSWKSLLVEVVRWLINSNHLTQSHCPILKTPRSKRYVVSTEAVHSDKKQFTSPIRAGSLYIETNTSSRGIAKGCRTVIEHVGQDPAQFKIRFSPPGTQSAPS